MRLPILFSPISINSAYRKKARSKKFEYKLSTHIKDIISILNNKHLENVN